MGEAVSSAKYISIDTAIVSILDSCRSVQTQEEFKSLLTGKLRAIIPHQMAMIGFVDLWRFNVLNHINLGYPEQYIDRLIVNNGQFKSPLIHCWKKKFRPFYINDLALMEDIDSNWVGLVKSHNIKNFLVHGVVDISGKLTSYFSFANSATGWNASHCQLIELILPSLHVAMKRVVNSNPIVENKIVKLSIREIEVLKLLHGGKTNKQIATILGISDNTVRNHVHNAFEKLGVNNRAQAVAKAVSHKLIYV